MLIKQKGPTGDIFFIYYFLKRGLICVMLRMYFMDRKEIQETRIGKKQVECELTEKDKTQVRTYDSFT